MFLAIVSYDDENRVSKYQPFSNTADALAHVEKHGGFAVSDQGVDIHDLLVDPDNGTVSVSIREPNAPVYAEISRLEGLISRRLSREALLGKPGKDGKTAKENIQDIEDLIVLERAKLIW